MKKLFYFAVALFMGIAINTSCGVNEESSDVYTAIATVVEGTSSIPYTVVFDDGKEAYVTNTNIWSPSFSENNKELRYIIAYEIISETSSVFDLEIEIVQVNPIATQPSGLKYITAADFTGDNGLQNYESGASVSVCFLSPARDYLTLVVLFNGAYTYTSPNLVVAYNNDRENSPYKELYKDDGYYYVELYHDTTKYAGTQELSTYISCKMPDVDVIKSKYNGIKILAKNHYTMQPEAYTFNFTTDENQTAAQ